MYKTYIGIKQSMTFIIIISTILIFISCSDDQSNRGNFSFPPMPVEVATVNTGGMTDQFEAVGTIEAMEEVTIVSEIDASVVSLPFKEGSFIKKGELIAQLDDSQLMAEVNRTEALYNQSKSSYNRIKTIVEQNVGTQQGLDDALASLKVAEANLELSKARFNKTKIVAPFSGMVGTRDVSIGTFLRTGQEITELANLDEIRIKFSVPERFLAKLIIGAEVIVSSNVYPGYQIKGNLIAIEPILDSQTRNVQVVAKMKNPGQRFRPGMSANVSVVLSERPEALTVPNESVFANGNQSFVFMIKADSTVSLLPVTLGSQTADNVEIINGLQEGMQVVRAGHQKLFEGAKVMPIMLQGTESKQ